MEEEIRIPARNVSQSDAGGEETIVESQEPRKENKLSVPVAIIIAGVIIAGAILLKGSSPSENSGKAAPAKITKEDRILGEKDAKVTVILYEDFQCPFCGAINGHQEPLIQALKERDASWSPFVPEIKKYVDEGQIALVYRDWAFLGPESVRSAEAARCAGDQNKFWEYHDYLYSHQSGENEGAFVDANLKAFATNLGLETAVFDKCLDEGKYAQAVVAQKDEGSKAGVQGTPKGFILKKGKVVSTIEGAEGWSSVKSKLDAALK